MTRSNHTRATTAIAIGLAALTFAACGSDDDGDSDAAAPPKTASGAEATVGKAKSDLGEILVDSQGRTVYLFKKDSGPKSSCEDECATEWPPVRASGKPAAGDGLDAAKLSTTPRSDGEPQVTYDGHPLYLFSGDKAAGDTAGQGVGSTWYVVGPDGNEITAKPSEEDDKPSGGGGGYGY